VDTQESRTATLKRWLFITTVVVPASLALIWAIWKLWRAAKAAKPDDPMEGVFGDHPDVVSARDSCATRCRTCLEKLLG
jgi:hypothetical protein